MTLVTENRFFHNKINRYINRFNILRINIKFKKSKPSSTSHVLIFKALLYFCFFEHLASHGKGSIISFSSFLPCPLVLLLSFTFFHSYSFISYTLFILSFTHTLIHSSKVANVSAFLGVSSPRFARSAMTSSANKSSSCLISSAVIPYATV